MTRLSCPKVLWCFQAVLITSGCTLPSFAYMDKTPLRTSLALPVRQYGWMDDVWGYQQTRAQSLSRQCALCVFLLCLSKWFVSWSYCHRQLIILPGFGFLTALWSCHDLTQRSRRDIIAGHQSRCCFEACGMSMYTLCTDSIFREYLRTRPLVVDRNYSPPELCDATVIMLYATGSAGICAYIHSGHDC